MVEEASPVAAIILSEDKKDNCMKEVSNEPLTPSTLGTGQMAIHLHLLYQYTLNSVPKIRENASSLLCKMNYTHVDYFQLDKIIYTCCRHASCWVCKRTIDIPIAKRKGSHRPHPYHRLDAYTSLSSRQSGATWYRWNQPMGDNQTGSTIQKNGMTMHAVWNTCTCHLNSNLFEDCPSWWICRRF